MCNKTLLVVDDEPNLCDIIARSCKGFACKIIVAFSGKEALHIIESKAVDLVVCDIRMPNGNGLWLLEQLVFRGIKPSVFCFYSADPAIKRSDVLQLGADEFFEKLYGMKNLREWIRRQLEECA